MIVREGNWLFEFEPGWVVTNYDADDSDYRRYILPRLDGTRAVDLLAANAARSRLVMFEIKDFTGHFTENLKKLDSPEFYAAIGRKARDTVAGVVGLHRTVSGARSQFWGPYHDAMSGIGRLEVILWLEGIPQRLSSQFRTYRNELKRTLSWLTPHVQVYGRHDPLHGLGLVDVRLHPEASGRGAPRTLPGQATRRRDP